MNISIKYANNVITIQWQKRGKIITKRVTENIPGKILIRSKIWK